MFCKKSSCKCVCTCTMCIRTITYVGTELLKRVLRLAVVYLLLKTIWSYAYCTFGTSEMCCIVHRLLSHPGHEVPWTVCFYVHSSSHPTCQPSIHSFIPLNKRQNCQLKFHRNKYQILHICAI
jgi:hypothetical protein